MSKALAAAVAPLILALGLLAVCPRVWPSRSQAPRVVPAPTVDEQPADATVEVTVLAGGCFWGVQGAYQHVIGVTNAVSGYAGGERETAHYERVSGGGTGHAEAVQVVFDPRTLSYGRLLQIFFSVIHDPTELNRQGADVGTQYRSALFPTSAEQERIAKAYIAQLDRARLFERAIATTVETERAFYPAEAQHQDFLVRNPTHPYIVLNDLPTLEELKRLFPERYRAEPVLVAAAGRAGSGAAPGVLR